MEWLAAIFTAPFYTVYESSCIGFHLARELRNIGVACDAIVITAIARSDEDRKQKTVLRDAAPNEAPRRYILIAEENIEQVGDLNSELLKMAALPRWRPYVDAISLIKGVDWFGALLVATEIGDFDRFRGDCDVSKWIGTISKEDSCGEKVSRGCIIFAEICGWWRFPHDAADRVPKVGVTAVS